MAEDLKTARWELSRLDEPGVEQIARTVAISLFAGDALTLHGDLGAGKTTFAREVIRTLTDDPFAEVPSPTFTLVQTYETLTTPIAHFDLYRLGSAEELEELGFEHHARHSAVLIEWPERADERLPPDRLEIHLVEDTSPAGSGDGETSETRRITLVGQGLWSVRLDRLKALSELLERAGLNGSEDRLRPLAADASTRRYARLSAPDRTDVLLMDWPRAPDGPPVRNGKPYSQIAHIAEDVSAFLAVQNVLRPAGVSVPHIHGFDLTHGYILLEDLGEGVFGDLIENGAPQETLWADALQVLVATRSIARQDWDAPQYGIRYRPAFYDRGALKIEVDLFPDWAWPLFHGGQLGGEARREFEHAWGPVIDALHRDANTNDWSVVLRDFHSPNLIWREAMPDALQRVGVIDFQDAVNGPPAYDVVSLLQDARVDVPADLEARLLSRYVDSLSEPSPDAPRFHEEEFRKLYAFAGAQRSTKILGIFARLHLRDGKPRYLRHMPRIWGYLERNLTHPELWGIKEWYDRHMPAELRRKPLAE